MPIAAFGEEETPSSADEALVLVRQNEENADKFDLDLETPSSPGFVVIGLTPKEVGNPGTLKDFAFELASFLDGEELKPGFAVSTVPYWWGTRKITFNQYKDNSRWFQRILARTQLSAAISEDENNGKDGVKVGIGFQSQLLDAQDPKFYTGRTECISKAWDDHAQETWLDLNDTLFSEAIAKYGAAPAAEDLRQKYIAENYENRFKKLPLENYKKARADCKEAATKNFLRRKSLNLGIGTALKSENGKVGDLSYDGLSVWTTYRHPLNAKGSRNLVLFVRGDANRDFDVADDKTAEGHGVLAAASLALNERTWNADATVSYNYRGFKDGMIDEDSFLRYSVSFSYRIRKDLWLELSAGVVSNADFDEEGFGLVQLKLDLPDDTGS